ncbi:MAG: sugar phosphate nucleotidyltransferase [Candidatus Atabeyarchaeum deiterrae]
MMRRKKKLSITLDSDVVRKISSMIDGVKLRNLSQAVESLLVRALVEKMPLKAFILAGGKGTRLRPITYEIPKPLVPLQGKPILEHVIDLLRTYEVRDIVISIGYLGEKIKEYFRDEKRFGVKITFVEEEQELGTGGPLRLAKHLLKDTFIMVNGDNLMSIDLYKMYQTHRENRATATIALTTVDDPSSYGVAVLEGNKIIKFVEKPRKEDAPSKLINTGLYILEPSVIDLISDGRMSFIEKDVFPRIAEKGELYGYVFSGQWFDTGTPERYEKALKEWRGVA